MEMLLHDMAENAKDDTAPIAKNFGANKKGYSW